MAASGGPLFRTRIARPQDPLQAILFGFRLGLGDAIASALHLLIRVSACVANACGKLRFLCLHRRIGVRLVSSVIEFVRRVDH